MDGCALDIKLMNVCRIISRAIFQADRACIEKKLEKKLASAQIPARTKAQRKASVVMSFRDMVKG